MVKILSDNDKKLIEKAIAEAEQKTCAEIVTVIAPASDAYQSYIMLYGLVIGSIISTLLWKTKLVSAFPLLLLTQLATIAIFSYIPWLRHFLLTFIPRRIRNHRAAHRAYEEYLKISHYASATTPIVLLYISIIEHYTHIITSRLVREKVANTQWEEVINKLTGSIKNEGFQNSCVKAINNSVELLVPYFPANGEKNAISNSVREIKE